MAAEERSRPPTSKASSNGAYAEMLRVFASASRGTLVAWFVALAALLYVLLGGIGLLFIGAIAGAFAYDALEVQAKNRAGSLSPSGPEFAGALLNWPNKKPFEGKASEQGESSSVITPVKQHVPDHRPETKEALTALQNALFENYVRSWSHPLFLTTTPFELSCQREISGFFESLYSLIARKRPADAFLNFSTNVASILLVFLRELSIALADPSVNDTEVSSAISVYLKNNADGSLANLLDREEQEKKLIAVSSDFLEAFLDPGTKSCQPARTFLQEAIARIALESVLESCSQPGWINDWIVYLLEGDEPEIMNAIDAEVGRVAQTDVGNSTSSKNEKPSVVLREAQTQNPSDVPQRPISSKSAAGDEAQEQARKEAERLSNLIALEVAEKTRMPEEPASSRHSTVSIPTPTSSQSDVPDLDAHETLANANEVPRSSTSSELLKSVNEPFTEFDQILPPSQVGLQGMEQRRLTLFKARVLMLDDPSPMDSQVHRSKPISAEYLLQVEPSSTHYAGWIVSRRYGDFEALHSVVSRIAMVSGVTEFPYRALPSWSDRSRGSLRADLASYLESALSFAPLAECEAMRRFLDKKDQTPKASTFSNNVLGFSKSDTFQNIGKGVFGALTNAPKGAAGGGKAIIDGVSGVFGGTKKSRSNIFQPSNQAIAYQRSPTPSGATEPASSKPLGDTDKPDESSTIHRASVGPATSGGWPPERPASNISTSETSVPIATTTTSSASDGEQRFGKRPSVEEAKVVSLPASTSAPSLSDEDGKEPRYKADGLLVDDPVLHSGQRNASTFEMAKQLGKINSEVAAQIKISDMQTPTSTEKGSNTLGNRPLSTDETAMAIELMFAVVNELFSLTSVWSVRRTFLNAAKRYTLRPGNSGLDAIKELIQRSVIDANINDEGIATHINKIRENALPTEEELKRWPPPKSPDELEALRLKARSLFVERAMPQALISIMGLAASGEALGKVFDALQMTEVSRGLVFALLLQAARMVIY